MGATGWALRKLTSKSKKEKLRRYEAMIRTVKMGFVVGLLAAGIAAGPAMAQDSMKQDSMKQDDMNMKHDGMMHEESAKRLFTGKFSGKVHKTEGRATVYQQADGKLLLRLTGFKTSNGPDVHVVLLAIKDQSENANSLKSNTERVELGKLKGNEGDQNYEIPAGTDLSKFTTVSIYCERFNANFGAAPLEKF
jgi:pentapeptide MXKDX repeat protein